MVRSNQPSHIDAYPVSGVLQVWPGALDRVNCQSSPYFILQSEASIGRQRNLKFRFGKDKSLLDTGGDVSIAGRGFMIATATLLIELDLWVCGVASFQGAFIPL